MKMRTRILSIGICLALLMSMAPVDPRLGAGFASAAEGEIAAAEGPAIEAVDEAPEALSEEAEIPEIEEPEEAPEAAEANIADAEQDLPAEDAAEPAEAISDEIPTEAEEPVEGAPIEEAPAEDAVAIDYAADASASPDFALGYAEVLRDATPVFASDAPDAEAFAKLSKGVVYAVGRTELGAACDRIEVLFNADPSQGVASGWVDARALRPMEPQAEAAAYVTNCAEMEGIIFPEKLDGRPLAKIACEFPEASADAGDAADEIQDIEDEEGADASEPAEEPQEHPLVDLTPPEDAISTMPLPLDEPVISLVEVEPEAQEASLDVAQFDAVTEVSLRANVLYLGLGESFDLPGTGFVRCAADEGAKVKLSYAVTEGDCAIVSNAGVVMGTGIGEGVVTITETNSGANAQLLVNVQAAATSVTIRESLTLGVGMTADLNVCFPEDSYSTYSLSVEPEGIVSLDPRGKVTAVAPGCATVSVLTNSGQLDTCYVTVVSGAVSIQTDEEITLALGEDDRYVRAVALAGEEEIPCEFTFTVTDGQENLRVDSATGELTALNLGSATVTVSAPGAQSADCLVHIATSPASVALRSNSIKLGVGETYQISDGEDGIIALSPGSYMSSYRYLSGDAGVASVSESGLIRANGTGTARITIIPSSENDPLLLEVNVLKAAPSIKLSESEITLRPGEQREIKVSFPDGGYSNYTLSFSGSGGDEEDEAPVSIVRGSGDSWTLIAASEVDGGAILPLIAKAASGAADACVVQLMPGPGEDEIELEITKTVLGIDEPGGKVVAHIADGALAASGFNYTSSNPSVISVDSEGNLSAHSISDEDGVTITATATVPGPEGYASAESDPIVVVSYPTKFEFAPGKETLRLGVGDSYALRLGEEDADPDGILDIGPSGARTVYSYKIASGGDYGALSDDGVITAKKAGTMQVRITPASGSAAVTAKTLRVEIFNAATNISLSQSNMRVGAGISAEPLKVSFPANTYARFTASSSNPDVLRVSQSGDTISLEPVSDGQAIVTVRTASCADSCLVEVVGAAPSVTLDAPSAIGVGEQGGVVSARFAGNALSATITFQSNNLAVLAVDPDSGALTANSAGNATISAYLNYRGDGTDVAAASQVVSVVPAPRSISLDPSAITLHVDERYQITSDGPGAMIALDAGAHASFSYTSSSPAIASVSPSGEITGVKAGECAITIAAQNGVSAVLGVKVVKDFTIKSNKQQLGVGMRANLTATDAPKGAVVSYSCAPAGALEIAADGSFQAKQAGVAVVTASAMDGSAEKVSNAVLVTVLPAPTAAQILFSSESATRVSHYQSGAKVVASCAPGTMAELGYRLVAGAPAGVSINDSTGALTIGGSGSSFTVETYDRNNGTSASHNVAIVDSGELAGLKISAIQLLVGETYQLSDGPDGIIDTGSAGSTGSYKFKSSKKKVAAVSDGGLITAKKAGTAKIRITSAANKKNYKDLTVKIVADGGVSLTPGLLTLGVGMTGQLTASSATLTLSSANPEIATVDAFGNVRAIAEGDVNITATAADGRSDTALIHVVPVPKGVEVELDEIWMGKAEKNMRVAASILPADGAEPAGSVEYELADEDTKKYLSVNRATGALTAKKATKEDEPVTVRAYLKEYPTLSAYIDVYIVKKTSVSLTQKTLQLGLGDTCKLRAYIPEESDDEEEYALYDEGDEEDEEISGIVKLTPEEARANTTFSYKTSNSGVASVSADGLITARATGSAKITIATQSNRSAKLTVKVAPLPGGISLDTSNLELGVGMTHQFKPKFTPADTYANCMYSSSDEEVAIVSPSGLVEAVGEGEAIVTARSANGLTANCRVAVLPGAEEIYILARRGGKYFDLTDGDSLTVGVGEKNLKLSATANEGALAQFSFALANKSDSKKLSVNKTTGALSAKKASGDEPVDVLVIDKYNEDNYATISVEILPKPKKRSNLSLSPSAISLCTGETFLISEQNDEDEDGVIRLAEGYAASYSFKSKNSSVASVNSAGLVTAKSAGKTTIRVSTQNSSVYQDLTVTVTNKPTGMTIAPAMRLGSGMTATLEPSFTPANASAALTVASSNEQLLSASVNTATGKITLRAATVTAKTTATITVRAAGVGLADTCCVTLLPAPKAGEVAFDYDNMPAATRVNGSWVIRVGVKEKGACLAAKCSDPDAMSSFTYRSDSAALTVNAATGEMSSKTPGSYTVRATSVSNPSASCVATVQVVVAPTAIYFHESELKPRETEYTLQLGVGEIYQIGEYRKDELTGEEGGIIVLEPSDSSASYTFAASGSKTRTTSTGVLSVDKSTGRITAKQEGTAYVKITTQNSKSRIMTVQVVAAPESVRLEPATQSVGENSGGRVTLAFTPANSSSPAISYISSDSSLLTMRADGYFTTNDLRQTGVSEIVTITVTTKSGHSATAQVTVLPHPSAVSFAEANYTLTEGMTLATAPGSFPAGQMATKFSYSSDHPEIASIDAETGVITGVREGSATITITANPGKSYAVSGTATVSVEPAPARISYDGTGLPDVLKIAKGDVVTIPKPRAYTASGAETEANYSFALKTASDKSYLTIDGDKMTAIRSGKDVIITVSAHNSTAARPVTTELKVSVCDELPAKVELYFGERKVNGQTLQMYVNQRHAEDSIALSGKVSGANVNYGELVFSASGSQLISVSASGVVTAQCGADGKVPAGATATITATNAKSGVSANCTIQLGELCENPTLRTASLTMQEGEKQRIDISCTPSNAGMRMDYASSDAKVASVDADGEISAVGGGDATITITGQHGWSGEVAVSVLYNPDDMRLPVRRLYMQPGESVTLTPVLSRSGISPEKVNVYTEATTSYSGVVRVERSAEADQGSGTAASYTITAVSDSGGIAQRVAFTSYNGIEIACEVVVKAGGWSEDPSGFGWDEEAELYIVKGDSAPIEYGLSASAFTQGGGYEVAPAPGSEGLLEVSDGNVRALATGKAKLQLRIDGQAPREVSITVIDPVAPKLWYGPELNDPVRSEVKLDVGFEGVDSGNHTIRIEKLPAPQYSPDSVLLGTYNVTIEDETLLEFDRTADRVHTRENTGTTKLSVETFGSSISTTVKILPAGSYRALLISEWNGEGGGSVLPFAQQNIDWMTELLSSTGVDGKEYQVSVERNPKAAAVKSAIQTTFAETTENDVSLVYIVAHGHVKGSNGYKFSGANGIEVKDNELLQWLHLYIKGRVILIIDSCHSGGFIDGMGDQLATYGNIAVLAAQERPRAAAYYMKYKKISMFEFFTRALVTGLGLPKNVGKADPWGNKTTSADANRDGSYTVREIFDATRSMTIDMVDQYAILGKAGTYYWNAGNGGLMVGGISANSNKMVEWFNGGKQRPQIYIPSDMENLVLFNK